MAIVTGSYLLNYCSRRSVKGHLCARNRKIGIPVPSLNSWLRHRLPMSRAWVIFAFVYKQTVAEWVVRWMWLWALREKSLSYIVH